VAWTSAWPRAVARREPRRGASSVRGSSCSCASAARECLKANASISLFVARAVRRPARAGSGPGFVWGRRAKSCYRRPKSVPSARRLESPSSIGFCASGASSQCGRLGGAPCDAMLRRRKYPTSPSPTDSRVARSGLPRLGSGLGGGDPPFPAIPLPFFDVHLPFFDVHPPFFDVHPPFFDPWSPTLRSQRANPPASSPRRGRHAATRRCYRRVTSTPALGRTTVAAVLRPVLAA
jgi:hypothetical protein